MGEWLSGNLVNLPVLLLLTAAVVLAVRRLVQSRRKGKSLSCGGNCESCAMRGSCKSKDQ